ECVRNVHRCYAVLRSLFEQATRFSVVWKPSGSNVYWRQIRPHERPRITIQPELYTYDKLSTQAYNLLFASMGSMAAVVYEAAANDARLRDLNKPPANYNDTEQIIEIMFQIRSGFAHRPYAPDWRVNQAR